MRRRFRRRLRRKFPIKRHEVMPAQADPTFDDDDEIEDWHAGGADEAK